MLQSWLLTPVLEHKYMRYARGPPLRFAIHECSITGSDFIKKVMLCQRNN